MSQTVTHAIRQTGEKEFVVDRITTFVESSVVKFTTKKEAESFVGDFEPKKDKTEELYDYDSVCVSISNNQPTRRLSPPLPSSHMDLKR